MHLKTRSLRDCELLYMLQGLQRANILELLYHTDVRMFLRVCSSYCDGCYDIAVDIYNNRVTVVVGI